MPKRIWYCQRRKLVFCPGIGSQTHFNEVLEHDAQTIKSLIDNKCGRARKEENPNKMIASPTLISLSSLIPLCLSLRLHCN